MWEAGFRMMLLPGNWGGMKLPGTCTAVAKHTNSSECRNDTADTFLANHTSANIETAETTVMPHWNEDIESKRARIGPEPMPIAPATIQYSHNCESRGWPRRRTSRYENTWGTRMTA